MIAPQMATTEKGAPANNANASKGSEETNASNEAFVSQEDAAGLLDAIAAQMVTTQNGSQLGNTKASKSGGETNSSNELFVSQDNAADLLDVSVSSVKRAQELVKTAPERLVINFVTESKLHVRH